MPLDRAKEGMQVKARQRDHGRAGRQPSSWAHLVEIRGWEDPAVCTERTVGSLLTELVAR